jgi:hypothetical protein
MIHIFASSFKSILPLGVTKSVLLKTRLMIHSQSMMRQEWKQMEWKGGQFSQVNILLVSALCVGSSA